MPIGILYVISLGITTKVKQEKSFTVHWISSKCKENFGSFCFICMESAKESHC